MSTGRLFTAIGLAVAVLGLLAGASKIFSEPGEGETTANAALADIDPEVLVSGADLDATINELQNRLARSEDSRVYTALGVAYLQKARETGDPSYYSQTEGVLDRALDLDSDSFDALTSLGALALARHDFAQALEYGIDAKAINPHNAHNYGVIGDALLELGRYDEAFAAFQTMVDLRPDLSSYARVSYAREVTGDIEGAIVAMKQARDAGGPRPENVAYTTVLLGNLYFNSGDIDAAQREYEQAVHIMPDYPAALAGQGRVAAARGDLQQAQEQFELAMNLSPTMEHAVLLGDIYRKLGLLHEARRADGSFWDIVAAERDAGANVDMEVARFIADRGGDLELAERLARAVYEQKPSIFAADTLAWVLFKAGHIQEAAVLIEQALRTGTQDASILFHAGVIAEANGQHDIAGTHLQRALSTDPNFSLASGPEASVVERIRAGPAARRSDQSGLAGALP